MEPVLSVREINELILSQHFLTRDFVEGRTVLTSALIPTPPYTALSTVEAWKRWPEIMVEVANVAAPEDLAQAMRVPGSRVGGAYVWALANIGAGGRLFWRMTGDPMVDEAWRLSVMFDFWRRTALTWRDDGFLQAWDAGSVIRPYGREVVDQLADHAVRVDGDAELHDRARHLLAQLMQFTFLVWLESRMGVEDTGPYPLPGGRTMVIREFINLERSWLPWSDCLAGVVPRRDLVCGLIYRPGIQNRVSDFGQTFSKPPDAMSFLESVAVCEPEEGGRLTVVPLEEWAGLEAAVRRAQKIMYREIAGWSWEEKVFNGAHAYFCGLIRPWPLAAGIVDRIDWTVPREAGHLVPLLRDMPDSGGLLDEPQLLAEPEGTAAG